VVLPRRGASPNRRVDLCTRSAKFVRRRFDPAQRCQQSARFVVILTLHRPRQTAAVTAAPAHRGDHRGGFGEPEEFLDWAEGIGFDRRQQFSATSGRGRRAAEAPDADQYLTL
jgi:hypothetical protein